jgi:hypothetical protein
MYLLDWPFVSTRPMAWCSSPLPTSRTRVGNFGFEGPLHWWCFSHFSIQCRMRARLLAESGSECVTAPIRWRTISNELSKYHEIITIFQWLANVWFLTCRMGGWLGNSSMPKLYPFMRQPNLKLGRGVLPTKSTKELWQARGVLGLHWPKSK